MEPKTITALAEGLLIHGADGSKRVAYRTTTGLWIVGSESEPEQPPPQPPPGSRFIWPFPLSQVTSEFGPRWGRLHAGIDFGSGASNNGGAIQASSSGKVIIATNTHSGYGNTVVLDHGGGLCTLYAHMALGTRTVNVGDRVTQGQKLGNTGNTGASKGVHLHFETHEGGYKWAASAVDPRKFFEKWNK